MADIEGGQDRIDQLRLIRTPRIGPVSYLQLLRRFGSASEAIRALPDLARRGGGQAPAIPDRGIAEREMAQVARLGARHVMLGDHDYPALLARSTMRRRCSPCAAISRWRSAPAWRWSVRAMPPPPAAASPARWHMRWQRRA